MIRRKRKIRRVRPVQAPPLANANSLRITAVRALRLYRKIASDRSFARRLASLLPDGSITEEEKLIQTLYPRRITVTGLGGFFVRFGTPTPTDGFGTMPDGIRTPSANAAQLRIIARTMIPLFLKISMDRAYTARLIRAINTDDAAELLKAVREVIHEPRLVKATISREQLTPEWDADVGFNLFFRFGKYLYYSFVA